MAQDVAIKCKCGKVTGIIHGLSAASSNHVMCPCRSCQAYAWYLGRSDDMLDANGYSNIFQIDPATLEVREGLEHLASVRITPKGPLRWYTDCCKTPIGNTLSQGGIPFVGVLPICTGHKGTSDAVIAMVGPVRARVNEQPPVPFRDKLRTWGMFLHLIGLMLMWRIRGGKSWKPFFDKDTLQPIRTPVTLGDAERTALYAKAI